MTIVLDYDGTYTEDPILWHQFIRLAKKRGHKIICVTMRYPYEIDENPSISEFIRNTVEIIFTSRKAKAVTLLEMGIDVDIWIDDNPIWLFKNSNN
jgi:hypothetical protein